MESVIGMGCSGPPATQSPISRDHLHRAQPNISQSPKEAVQALIPISKHCQQMVQQHVPKCNHQTARQHISDQSEFVQNHLNTQATAVKPENGVHVNDDQNTSQTMVAVSKNHHQEVVQPHVPKRPQQAVKPHIPKRPHPPLKPPTHPQLQRVQPHVIKNTQQPVQQNILKQPKKTIEPTIATNHQPTAQAHIPKKPPQPLEPTIPAGPPKSLEPPVSAQHQEKGQNHISKHPQDGRRSSITVDLPQKANMCITSGPGQSFEPLISKHQWKVPAYGSKHQNVESPISNYNQSAQAHCSKHPQHRGKSPISTYHRTVLARSSKHPKLGERSPISMYNRSVQIHSSKHLKHRVKSPMYPYHQTVQSHSSRHHQRRAHSHVSNYREYYFQNHLSRRFSMTETEPVGRVEHRGSQRSFNSSLSRLSSPPIAICHQTSQKDSRSTDQSSQQGIPGSEQQLSEKYSKKKSSKIDIDHKKQLTKREPLTPDTLQANSVKVLTAYEQDEIKSYEEVWYLGEKANGAKIIYSEYVKFNGGYDDESGLYNGIKHDHLAYRYEILQSIGSGFSGQVFKCRDHKINEVVAVKVIRNTRRCHRFGEIEIKNLKALQKTDKKNKANIVHMKDFFYFRDHLCITFEFFQKDLQKALKESRKRGFSEDEVRKYAIDVLKCLQVLKKKKIIHGDLKPENILLHTKDGTTIAAVTDFGGSCFEKDSDCPKLFTVAYVSPEILLGKRCSTATDMWSLGCTLAKLYLGSYLFEGLDNIEQFMCIMKVLGVPPATLLNKAPKRHFYFDSNGVAWKIKEITQQRTSLATKLKCKDGDFLDFIERCLVYNPRMRLTPEKAMEHPWIKKKEITKPCVAAAVSHKKTKPSF